MVNKFLPYRPLKCIVKLGIKLNLYLYLFEWTTYECQSLSRLFLLIIGQECIDPCDELTN